VLIQIGNDTLMMALPDRVFVKVNGEARYIWRTMDREGKVLETYVAIQRDRKVALKSLRKLMKCYRPPTVIMID